MLGLKGKCYFSLGLIDRKGLPRWLSGKESTCQCRRCRKLVSDPWVRKIPWRKKWQPTPVFLPRKFHGERGAWWATVHRVAESDTTE